MEFGESVQQLQWENPTRSTIMPSVREPALKRGPALTFLDQGPKIIVKPKKTLQESNNFGQQSNDISSSLSTAGSGFPTIKSLQDDLEADYIEERQQYKTEDLHQNERIDLNEVPFYDYLDDDYSGSQINSKGSAIVKKSIYHNDQASFDQLVTFKPSHKADKFGQAEIIHHPTGHIHNDYLASASGGHDDHTSKSGMNFVICRN